MRHLSFTYTKFITSLKESFINKNKEILIGSPMAPIVTELDIRKKEKEILPSLEGKLKIYIRYRHS